MKTARRMEHFKPSVFSSIRETARQDAIDFTLGSPDIAPNPTVIKEIQAQAGVPANYKYAVNALPALTEQIQKWYQDRYKTDLEQDEICLLQGSQEALVNLPLVFCDPGDGVLIPDPYYPAYAKAPLLAQAEVLYMPLKKEKNYLADLDAISKEDRKKAKLMLISYPNNPTGAAAPDEFYEKLIQFARDNDILIVHDNAYSDLVFDGKPGKSFLSFPGAKEVGVELNSFSKSYGMAGARLGVLAGNKEAVQAYKALKSNLDYGIFLPVQYGGIKALEETPDQISQTRDSYQHRRDLLVEEFGRAGWKIEPSAATMFLWAPVPKGMHSEPFAKQLADKTGVLVTPGTAFGKEGEGFVRIALVQDDEAVKEAARRIKASGIFSQLQQAE